MKKILFYLASTIALVGCMNEDTFIVENPALESYESFSAPLEISVGESRTKAFDGELKWTWEESDKIYGYQVAGGNSVNTLSFVEDNRFGTPEFVYSSQDAATFHFVYAGDATIDEAADGYRGIKQDSRQSGEWSPVLVGSAVGKIFAEVMNDEAEINMEHLSAALEVRLWNEDVDRNNLTDADKKNIVYAELMSDTENFLLDIIPTYNQDGTVTYSQREKGQDEDPGAYIRTAEINCPTVVFNIAPHAENYSEGDLTLAIIDENGDKNVLDVPALNFVAGKRTILNVVWVPQNTAHLPEGTTFNSTVDAFMTGKGITAIKFITNSATTSENVLVDGSIYLVQNGNTLEIHTAADQYVANSNCKQMFYAYRYNGLKSFAQIQTIDFGKNFNTQNVSDMMQMFSWCSSLTSLDVSNFDTQNVTDMAYMFYNCSGLTTLDVSSFNTQNVIDMQFMFSDCSRLTTLDLSSFNTQNVIKMRYMFYRCSSLSSLNISKLNTEKVTNMAEMFSGCSRLTSLDLRNFNTQNVTSMGGMFYECSGLTSLDVSNFNTQNVTNMGGMFYECSGLTSLDISNFNTQNVTNMTGMFYECSGLTSLDLRNFNTQNVTNMSIMLSGCSSLSSLNISKFNTGKVTMMVEMFSGCSRLTSLDLSNFNTENVTEMTSMFSGCSSISSLNISKFNTGKVTDMSSLFEGCLGLTSLDISSFNTQNVTNMSHMFDRCRKLTSLNLRNFNTAKVIDMNHMFHGCEELTSLNLRSFNTEKVVYMNSMFDGCRKMDSFDISSFNTQNVANMSYMFANCTGLDSLDLSNFNTENVTNMRWMFGGCGDLQSLKISNFNTQKVVYMNSMFDGCYMIGDLDLRKFTFTSNPTVEHMFRYTGKNSLSTVQFLITAAGKQYLVSKGNSNINLNYLFVW